MIIWCDKPELKITSDIEPVTCVRKPIPSDSKEKRKEKKKKPYLNKKRVLFDINYLGNQYCIVIQAGYTWDGATCLGLHHLPVFLNASMLHDKLCENRELIGNDRQLSSIVFREMSKSSGVWKWFANVAYKAVDTYQKTQGWEK